MSRFARVAVTAFIIAALAEPAAHAATPSAARTGDGHLWMVDTSVPITSGEISTVASKAGATPAVWGRYINFCTSGCTSLSTGEITLAAQRGISLLFLSADPQNGKTGSSKGTSNGNATVSAARNLGIPRGALLVDDIESGTSLDAAYLKAWFQAVTGAGYLAGYYSGASGFASAFCSAESSLAAMKNASIDTPDTGSYGYGPSRAPAFSTTSDWPSCGSRHTVWQYTLAGGSVNFDQDEVDPQAAGLLLPNGAVSGATAPGGQVADIDGDGDADLIAESPDGTLYDYPSSGSLSAPYALATRNQIGTGFDGYGTLLAGDVDGDHHADLVAETSDGALYDYPGTGSLAHPYTSATRNQIGTGFDGFTTLALGDVDGDGKADLVALAADGTLYDYPSSGSIAHPYTSATRNQIGTGFGAFASLSLGDLDGDGAADLIAESSDGTLYDYPSSGSIAHPYTSATRNQIGTGFDTFALLRAADVDGNRHGDLLALAAGGDLTAYPGSGSLTHPFDSATRRSVGSGFDQFTVLT